MGLLSRTNLTICLLTLGCILCRVISQSYPEGGENSHFYPYGPDIGDTTLPRNDDESSSQIALNNSFRFFGQEYNSLWVNTNGVLSMFGRVDQFTPDPFPWAENIPVIAPFWTDIDTRNHDNSFIYYREDMSTDILQRASNDVREAFGRELALFQASWSFIATWHRVTYFGWDDNNGVAPENTFQVACVSNGLHTFVFYQYGDIMWTTGTASGGNEFTGLGGTPAQVGFDASDSVNYYNVDGSRTDEIVNIQGTFSFRIDGSTVSDNGCASHGDVTLTPRSGSFLGGDLVTVTGPCFLSADEVHLDFFDVADEYNNSMLCEHVSEEQVTCLLEKMDVLGLQQVRLRIIRNTTDIMFSFGTFQVLYDVGVEQLNILGTAINGAQILNWNPEFFESMENETLVDLIFTRISLNSDMQVQYEDIIILQDIDLRDRLFLISEDEFLLNIMHSQLNMEFYGAPCLVHQVTGQKLYGAIGPALWFKTLQLYAILRLRSDLTPLSPAIAILSRFDQFVASIMEEFDLEEKEVFIRFPSFDLPRAVQITLTWVIENEGQLDVAIFDPVCNAWLESDIERFGRIVESSLPPVPCFGTRQASRDGSFVADRTCWNGAPGCALYHSGQSSSAFNCYSSPSPLSIPGTPFTAASQQACYDKSGNLITSLLEGSGYFKSTHPRSDQLPVIHYFADQLPYLACCKFQTQGSRWCQLFQERRPTSNCGGYTPPWPVQTHGDPHISTLDGHEYTFNGHGQYWLVNSTNLKLQGRTQQYLNPSGDLVDATVWEGFVMKSADSAIVQVNTNLLNYVEILIDGVPISFADLMDSSVFFSGGQVTQEFGTKVVTVDFNIGVQIVITENNSLLNILLFLPQLLKGTTSGLMGTWNDDVEDDLTAGDGTGTIPLNSTAEEIFDFGWTWAVTEETSLFNYTDEASFAYFHRPEFRPTFTFTLPDEVVATTVCGDSVQCRYDLSVTGSVEIAASTAIVVKEFNETLEQLVTVPSCSFVEAPRNGWIVSDLFTEGSNISFHCNTHFHLEGPSHIICLEGALWNSDPPVCKSPYESPLQDAKENQVFLKLHINETHLQDYDDLWSNESQALMESIIPMFHEVYSNVPLFDNITIFDIKNGSIQLWLNLEATSPLTVDEKLNLLKTLQQAIVDNNGLLGDTYKVMAPVSILVDNGLGFWVEVSVLQLCDVYIVSGICQHGGQCDMDSGSPTCSCNAGYIGERCEIQTISTTPESTTPESTSDDSWMQRNKTLFWIFIGLGILLALLVLGIGRFIKNQQNIYRVTPSCTLFTKGGEKDMRKNNTI